MIKQKFLVELPHGVTAIATLTLDVPHDQQLVAELCGIGPEELKNLMGQEFQRMAADAGLNPDPGGI